MNFRAGTFFHSIFVIAVTPTQTCTPMFVHITYLRDIEQVTNLAKL